MMVLSGQFELFISTSFIFIVLIEQRKQNVHTSRFIFVNMNKTWEDAQSYCRKNHTDLASVRNQSENEELKKTTMSSYTWIGLYRNSWKWSDGTAQLLNNWAPDKPSNIATNACGTIVKGKWDNYVCSAHWYFSAADVEDCLMDVKLVRAFNTGLF
uniref:C-type lectin domain-containing protein n=1 Tax=Neolamprologus brichardi TaxID=32507 RepID=A0A3Q4GU17_NEOBR